MSLLTRVALAGLMLLIVAGPVAANEDDDSPMKSSTFSGLEMRSIGPALMSGRISDIVLHPEDPSTWYVAVGSGGVWKTANAAIEWTPIFDDQGSYSIGCLTLDPQNPSVVWVGTGENVSGRHVGYGDGVYRSRDGGQTWEHMGLKESEHIGRIVVHPENSDIVYVAAQGPLWSGGGERGLYLSYDGGQNWEKVLGGGEYTGVNEVLMDPTNPDIMYASTHQRMRNVAALVNGGPESGIHKSTDGGQTWREVTKGLPEEDMGKIGLAISPQRPNVVYATIELGDREGGFWRSEDYGESWEKRNDYLSGGTGPHYYQEIFASPHAFDRVYQMDVRMHVTHDGGQNFERVGEKHKHVDNHALAFTDDPHYLLAGCDGGLYESWDLGKNWKFVANLPVTQFYKLDVDYDEPFYHVVGGTQDNNTQYGPSRTDTVHGIMNRDWRVTLFGDGHQPAIDPSDPDIIYSQWQQGNHMRVDRVTGEALYIQPQPARGESRDRWNWDSPILISPHDPARIFVGSQRLWRSDDRGDSWTALSSDLTRDEDRLLLPLMGRQWSIDAPWDLYAMSQYNTITSIAESPVEESVLYVGTDDGLIQVSEDGGATWRRHEKFSGVPDRAYVNDIKADLYDADTVYAAFDAHKQGDFAPYLLRSTDRGRSWKSIAGDLPARHVVWRLVQDHEQPNLLFAGTEFGVFFTVDGGEQWIKLDAGAPNIAFRDLKIQRRENDLVGATFGRSFYVLDDYAPLRSIDAEALEQEALLFETRRAWWYHPDRELGGSEKASQGGAFFVAPNPPFGAVFTWYLRDALKTQEAQRQEQEKELAEEGEDTPYPGWEALREEELEEDPAVLLIVRDEQGDLVREVSGPTDSGIHRVAWDLRYPSVRPESDGEVDEEDAGVLAAPGTYTVELWKRVDGERSRLAGPVNFEVAPLRERGLKGAEPSAVSAFMRELAEMQRQINGANSALRAARDEVDAMKAALARSTVSDDELRASVREVEREIEDLDQRMNGNTRRARFNEQRPVSIQRRISVVNTGNSRSTYGPTPTHQENLEIAREDFAEVRAALTQIVESELPNLQEQLEAADVPWTPGRGVPRGD